MQGADESASEIETTSKPEVTSTSETNLSDDEEIITQIVLAGLRVLMVRKKDQIIYKLPDNMSVSQLSEQQRSLLMTEIKALHTATMVAAAGNAGLAGQTINKPIAPRQEGSLDIDTRFNMTPGSSPSTSQPQTPQSQEAKTTRKYVKTGKYSKKKQMQQQYHQQQQQFSQAPQYNQPANAAPLMFVPQSNESPATTSTASPSTPTVPNEFPSATSSMRHILKRLPEENYQNQEVKGRVAMALQHDHISVNTPDLHKPFDSTEDAIARLLPYHVYRIPNRDLSSPLVNDVEADALALQIYKRRAALYEKYANILTSESKNASSIALVVQAERHIAAELRAQLVEQQSLYAAEQAAQQEQIRIQAEKARLAAQSNPPTPQQPQPEQQSAQAQVSPQTSQAPVDSLAQAAALLQNNSRLASQYSQLSPELQQQLLQHRDQLAAQVRMIQQQRAAATAAANPPKQ
ncbi:hypothetical protein NQZ79_g4916 [Umbelopsis isabellina]|nr:hypothetical protein NQZ79_g4916 [Umbelopsis isabellina]